MSWLSSENSDICYIIIASALILEYIPNHDMIFHIVNPSE